MTVCDSVIPTRRVSEATSLTRRVGILLIRVR
jgi:hypothetical protein